MDSGTVNQNRRIKGLSFLNYLQSELRRGYLLENDEERYAARREKVYTFFKIPREIEKFLAYGFFQSADSFLFVLTFLPIRFIVALWCLITRPVKNLFGYGRNMTRLMKPAEIVDLLKGTILIICCYFVSYVDTSICYHIIKTQSTIKLYLFFNMLEIADRLMSAFGQDTLDALFWTATEPRGRKREHFGVIFHLIVATVYVAVHSTIVLLQALTLNVAINSDSKGLLTIVISNNFIELKGAVFKKFDRNNLLQISCSDVRERFHICVLLFVVVVQTMKEYSWKEERLFILLPDCFLVFGTEVMIDWLKHAFITRFNDIPVDVYRDYTLLIASDLIMCKQKYAYSDHSDLVARRMGFIPLPLGVVIYRILSQSLKFSNASSFIIFVVGFFCLLSLRVLSGIIILGKACDLISSANLQRSRNSSESIDKSNVTKANVDVIPISSKMQKQTVSQESEALIPHRDMMETINLKDKEEAKVIIPKESVANTFKCPKRSSSVTSAPPSSPARGLEFEEVSSHEALTFLGESQSGLMANSMVNLASVGINQGVTDRNAASNVLLSQQSSLDSPVDSPVGSPLASPLNSPLDIALNSPLDSPTNSSLERPIVPVSKPSPSSTSIGTRSVTTLSSLPSSPSANDADLEYRHFEYSTETTTTTTTTTMTTTMTSTSPTTTPREPTTPVLTTTQSCPCLTKITHSTQGGSSLGTQSEEDKEEEEDVRLRRPSQQAVNNLLIKYGFVDNR